MAIIAGNNDTGNNLLPVTTTPGVSDTGDETLETKQSAQCELYVKNHYMSVNSNPTQHLNKI
jgi:hypothetical protein